MNLGFQLTYLIFYGLKIHSRGHLGSLDEMHNRTKGLPGPMSLHSSNIRKLGKNSHHGANGILRAGLLGGNHSAFGRADSSMHGGKRDGVFGRTGRLGTELVRNHVLDSLNHSAIRGNIYAQDALDDIDYNERQAEMKHSIGALGRTDAEGRGFHRHEARDLQRSADGSMGHLQGDLDEMLESRRGLLDGRLHGFRNDHDELEEAALHGLALHPDDVYGSERAASAVEAQEQDAKVAAAANKLAAMENKGIEELVKDELKNSKASIHGAIAAQDAYNAGESMDGIEKAGEDAMLAHKAGKNAAEEALKNGATIPEAIREGVKEKKQAHEELSGADRLPSNPKYEAMKAAEMALAAGATPEEAEREGMKAAARGKYDPYKINAQKHEEAMAAEMGLTPEELNHLKKAAEKKRAQELAQHAEATKHEEAALEEGATPVEAKAVGLDAAKKAAQEDAHLENAEMAGEEAEMNALAHGASPLEARSAGERAAAGYLHALSPERALEHEHARAAAQEEKNEAAAAHAAAEELVNSVEDGVPDHKALENADAAGREAAAGSAAKGAAQAALEHGASPEMAGAIGDLAASHAMAKGAGAQIDPELHKEIKKEAAEAMHKAADEEEEEKMAKAGGHEDEHANDLVNEIKAADTQQAFGVIGTIPDDAKEVAVEKSYLSLPLKPFTSEKPKNKAEVAAKAQQAALAEKLRNKITKEFIPSPLNVVKGEDGYLNIPESAKKIKFDSGTVFFPEGAKEEMEKAGKDVSALEHRYNVGERGDIARGEGYYSADIGGFEMDLPSPTNKSPKKILSSKDKVLDISAATGINILSSKLEMTPWKDYAKKMRPDLNMEGIIKKPSGNEKEQKELESQLETLANTKTELITNPSGSQYVKLTPPLGVSEQISVDALLKAEGKFPKKVSDSGQDGISMLHAEEEAEQSRSLNIAHAGSPDTNTIESTFQKRVMEQAKKSPETSEITSSSNSFNPSATEAKKKELGQEEQHEESLEVSSKTASTPADQKCANTEEIHKNINDILKENSEKFSQTLGMSESSFASNISQIPDKVIELILRYPCEYESKKFQESYSKGYQSLETIFEKKAEPMLKILGNVAKAAYERSRPARIISTKIVRKPMIRKVPVYPKVKFNKKTGKLIEPNVVSHTTIRHLKPTMVEKKVLTPVKEVVVRKGPVLSDKNPPKIYELKEHVVMDKDGNIVKKSTQKDLPPNPKK